MFWEKLLKDFKGVQWFIYVKDYEILITSPTIPSSIVDSKKVIYSEYPVPARNYAPQIPIRNENRNLKFTLPIIQRFQPLGNSNVLRQFEILRNSDNPNMFSKNTYSGDLPSLLYAGVPKVLYYWGTHSSLMEYFLRDVSFSHNTTYTNQIGLSQYTDVSIELSLDEQSPLYKFDRVSRIIQARLGMLESAYNVYGQYSPTNKKAARI